jgi:hypothetical protein
MGYLFEKRLRNWIFFGLKYAHVVAKSNQHHILSIMSIGFFTVLFFHKSLLHDGTLMYVDMTWPSSLERTFEVFSTTWLPYGSFPNIENVQRLMWVYPLLIFSSSLHLSMSTYSSQKFLHRNNCGALVYF